MNQIRVIFILVFILSIQSLFAQKTKQQDTYKIWAYGDSHKPLAQGYLIELKDSSIIILGTSPSTKGFEMEVKINTIQKLKFQRNGQIQESIMWGALTGFGVGAPVGVYLDQGFGGEGFGGAILLGLPSAGVGGIIGGNRNERIYLYKDQENYESRSAFIRAKLLMSTKTKLKKMP